MEKTIARVGYAQITESTDSSNNTTYSYGPIKWFGTKEAGGREFEASPNGEFNETYADGTVALAVNENNGYDIKLTLLDLVDDVETDWFGNLKDSDGNIIEVNSGKPMPTFALVKASKNLKSSKKLTVETYFYCRANERVTRKSKTSEGKLDLQFPEFSIAARPRPDNDLVRYTVQCDELPESITIPTIALASAEE